MNEHPNSLMIEAYYHQECTQLMWEDAQTAVSSRLRECKNGLYYPWSLPLCFAKSTQEIDHVALPISWAWFVLEVAADIFDDIQDGVGKVNVWQTWPLDRSLPVAIGLLGYAQQTLARLSQTAAQGMWIQLSTLQIRAAYHQATRPSTPKQHPSVEAYMQRVSMQSAFWYDFFLRTTMSLLGEGEVDEETVERVSQFGRDVGVLSQLFDDLVDMIPNGSQKVGDIVVGRYNLAIILGLQKETSLAETELTDLLETTPFSEEVYEQLLMLLDRMGIAQELSLIHI